MEESKGLKQLYGLLQGVIFISVFVEFFILIAPYFNLGVIYLTIAKSFSKIFIWQSLLVSKFFIFTLILVVSIGTKPKKDYKLQKSKIIGPIFIGSIFYVGSVFILNYKLDHKYFGIYLDSYMYLIINLIGVLLLIIGFDNISKMIKTNIGKDRFNTENESFNQSVKKKASKASVNIPIIFKENKKNKDGWLNVLNVFRGSIVIGTPGSGKSFSIIIPFIKQLMNKGFSGLIYDYKYPDLGKLTYYHYLKNKKSGNIPDNSKFHVINLDNVEYSRRVNPLKPEYMRTIAEASETAESLVFALLKTGSAGKGSEQFFNQSAINFLSAVLFFFSKYEKGKYSTFAHILEFLTQGYKEMFDVLFSMEELHSLLAPFREAYKNQSYEQLDGQMGTLRINISRLANKETYWVFTGDDIDLKISDPKHPSTVILANSEATNSVNAASNALVLNRIIKLINTKGNRPTLVAVDELPTIYFHQIDKLIATARSNKVAVLLGLQELPQLNISYSKDVASNITSVVGNVFSGAVRNKQTLDWLVTLFGKIKQVKEGLSISKNSTTLSINESMDNLIPASKISSLRAGEMVIKLANEDLEGKYDFDHGTYNCKINIDVNAVSKEESQYTDLPMFYKFKNKENTLLKNFKKVRNEVEIIVAEFYIPVEK